MRTLYYRPTVTFLLVAATLAMLATPIAFAHAITTEELVELFIALNIIPADKAAVARAALAEQTAAPTICPYAWTRNLTVGSEGVEVMKLQLLLNFDTTTRLARSGAGSPGNETKIFGPLTKAAVMKFQEKHGSEVLTPAGITVPTGFFGSFSRAKANALCASGGIGGPVVPPTTTPPLIVAGTELRAAAGTQPRDMLVPENASRVPFTEVVLTAGTDGAVTVHGITVERQGLAANSAFTGIVLMNHDGTIIGVPKTLNSDNRAEIGGTFTIPAGTSRTVIVGANMAADLDGENGERPTLSVVSVRSSATVIGTLPVLGATHIVNSSLAIGSATIGRGSFDPGTNQNKEIGTDAFTFASIRITSGSQEDLTLKSIRWFQSGSASAGDLSNIKTVVDGAAYPTEIDGRYYVTKFPGEGLRIDEGLSKDISIRGDIVAGSARSVDFDIDRNTDIFLAGRTFSFGITPSFGGSTISPDSSQVNNQNGPYYDASEIGISGGAVQGSAWSGVSAQNIGANIPDQILGGFSIDVRGESINVSSMQFNITLTESSGSSLSISDITNMTLATADGKVIGGPRDPGGTALTGTIQFAESITLTVGTNNFFVKGKLGSDFTTNDTVRISTTPSSDWTGIRGDTTGNTVTASPSSLISSPIMTVRSGELTISVLSQPSASTVVASASQFEFARYLVDALRSSEDIRITTLPLRFDTTGSRTDLTNCHLYDGTGISATVLTTGSNIKNPQIGDSMNATTFTFDGTGWVVPKNTPKTLSLRCDVRSGATGTYQWGLDQGQQSSYTGASGVTSGRTIDETLVGSNGQTMTAGAGGSYSVSADTSLLYRMVRAGATDVDLAHFRFNAGIEEDIDLRQIALILGTPSGNSPADLVGQRVTLWHGATQIGIAQFGSGTNPDTALATLSTGVRVKRGESVTIAVKGDLSPHNNIDGTPGALLKIHYNGAQNGLSGNYGTGVSSGTTLSGDAVGEITTNGVRIFRTVPTITDATTANSLIPGSDLYAVTITADSGRDIGIRSLAYNISTVGASVSDYQLFGPSGAVNTAAANPSGGVLRIVFDDANTDKLVIAGTSKTFRLRATTVSGITSGNTETLTIALRGDGAYPTVTGLMGPVAEVEAGGASVNNFVWTPFSATIPQTGVSINVNDDWTNGYGAPGFPGLGQNMSVRVFRD